jgi:hypothetical protein
MPQMALLPKSRLGRTVIIVLGSFILLVAFFYAEEDLRGWLAWENCKHELAAKGEEMDWDKLIPPPVPDGQNFFKAPNMAEWFVNPTKASSVDWSKQTSLGRHLAYPSDLVKKTASNGPVEAARIFIVPANNSGDALQFNDASAGKHIRDIIEDAIGKSSEGAQGLLLTAKTLNQIRPVEIRLQAGSIPSGDEIASFFDAGVTATNIGRVRVETGIDQNTFRVLLSPKASMSAADYLAWGEQAGPDFDLIREALKRPYARMDGDYSKPAYIPIPNFIAVRVMAQTLAQRATCDLLLGQPDKALQELTLMHDMCRLLEGAPTGKPMTLVAAMINVAVTGLYVAAIADGLQSHSWQEPQLAALQKQLAKINLTPLVKEGMQDGEQVGFAHWLQTASTAEFVKMAYSDFSNGRSKTKSSWQQTVEKTKLRLVPQGWRYQNAVTTVMLIENGKDCLDLTNNLVLPHKLEAADNVINKSQKHIGAYNFFAAIAIPNFIRAYQTTAHTQTLVNEAQIACALERYHLANGEYPATLDALAPKFIDQLPHDIVGGDPLNYRATFDGKFLLYSVGWNEKDDGGKDGGTDFTKADWVWKN